MSLDYAILGFLSYQPFSGYDLKKVFDTSVRHFWPADQSQIYRTLARLTERGWTEVEKVAQTDRPDRKVYSITPTGRQALRDWLAAPFPTEELRSAPLVQTFFSGQLPDEIILAKLEAAAAGMRATLERYREIPRVIEENCYGQLAGSPREMFFWMLTLEMGLVNTRTTLAWIESVIERVRDHQYEVHLGQAEEMR